MAMAMVLNMAMVRVLDMAKVLDMPGKGKLMHSLVFVTGYSCAGGACRVGCSVATGPWKIQKLQLGFQAVAKKSHSVMH